MCVLLSIECYHLLRLGHMLWCDFTPWSARSRASWCDGRHPQPCLASYLPPNSPNNMTLAQSCALSYSTCLVGVLQGLLWNGRQPQPQRLFSLDPDFEGYMTRSFSLAPSQGLFGLVLALQTCRAVTLYGFGLARAQGEAVGAAWKWRGLLRLWTGVWARAA